jgi:hypothetical protein
MIIKRDIHKLLKGKVHQIYPIRIKLLKSFPVALRKEVEKTWGTVEEIEKYIEQEKKL